MTEPLTEPAPAATAAPVPPAARPPRRWLPYLICILVGLALGVGLARGRHKQPAHYPRL